MDELFELFERNNSHNKMTNFEGIDKEAGEINSSDEEGEIKETYEIKDFDLADLENSFESNEFESQIDYLEDLLNGQGDMKQPDFSNFDNSIFDNIECDLSDIEGKLLVKSEPTAGPDGMRPINNKYLMRKAVESDDVGTTEDEGEDSEESIEEIELPAVGSILDSILASSGRNKTKSHVETTKKGRIVDKDAELEYLLPTDLEEKLSRIVISSNTALEEVGTFVQRIEGTQTITVRAARSDPILDLNTIVLDKEKRMVGMIDNIFGIKKEPMYLVVCKSQAIASSFRGEEQLFCAPFVENAYFTAIDTPDNHCDEQDSDLAFSDDEKEENFRRVMLGQEPASANNNKKKKKKANRKRKCGPNQFQNRSGPHPANNYRQKFAPQRNPFRAVNTQPFVNQAPMRYWQTPPAQLSNPMMMMPPPPINPASYMSNQYSFTGYPPPPPPPMMNANQCTSYQQFQKFFSPNQQ